MYMLKGGPKGGHEGPLLIINTEGRYKILLFLHKIEALLKYFFNRLIIDYYPILVISVDYFD